MTKRQKTCPICGKTFTPKTITSLYCSRQCGEKAYKRKKVAQKREELLKAAADAVPTERQYISVTEAIAIFGVARSTLYRLIRTGDIPSIRIGTKLIRIDRQKLETFFPARQASQTEEKTPTVKLYNLEPENCYTIGEIAKKFGISESSVYKHIRQYSVPTRQIGKFVYAPKSEIDNLYK